MAKKDALRKQVAALEKLAGLVEVSAKGAAKINGGSHHKKKHKPKGSGSTTPIGSGAVAIMPGGSGAILINPGSGALVARGTGA